jgi:branched-chain amino acid aminotransferase
MSDVLVWKICLRDFNYSVEPLKIDPVPNSLDESTNYLPGGVYTTFRTYHHNQVLDLAAHFSRLSDSARLSNATIVFREELLRKALHDVLRMTEYNDARIRLTLDLEKEMGILFAAVEQLNTPSLEDYQLGVEVITRKMHRENPKAKVTTFLKTAQDVRHQIPDGIHEVLMVGDNGEILEGLSSNFFGVIGEEIWTAEEGILSGITRTFALIAAQKLGIKIHLSPIKIQQLGLLEEAFITSASRSILPVQKIDQVVIGTGKPGSLFYQLSVQFDQLIEKELEEI